MSLWCGIDVSLDVSQLLMKLYVCVMFVIHVCVGGILLILSR